MTKQTTVRLPNDLADGGYIRAGHDAELDGLRALTSGNKTWLSELERAEQEHAIGYQRWYLERMYMIAPAGAYVGKWLQSFREFPPRQKPGSFNLERVMEEVSNPQQN